MIFQETRFLFRIAIIWEACSGVHLNPQASGIPHSGEPSSTHWICSTCVERILRVNVIENFCVADRLTVNCIMIVKPSVHRAIRMTLNNVSVYIVQHVFEITHFEARRGCCVRSVCETNVDRGTRPQETLFAHIILRSIMGLGDSHSRHIEPFKLRHGFG